MRLDRRAYRQLHHQVVHGKNCTLCNEWARTMHHLVPRSLGGEDVLENVVPVCGDGTRGCHGLLEANDPEARRALRKKLLGCHTDYITMTKSPHFLDLYYPLER